MTKALPDSRGVNVSPASKFLAQPWLVVLTAISPNQRCKQISWATVAHLHRTPKQVTAKPAHPALLLVACAATRSRLLLPPWSSPKEQPDVPITQPVV